MNEQARVPYSLAAQALMDAYYPVGGRREAKRVEFEAHGLVFTNNLGLKMLGIDRGADSAQYISVRHLPGRLLGLLTDLRDQQPDLWRAAVDTHIAAQALGDRFFDQLQSGNPDATVTGEAFETVKWQDHELRTQLFNMLPLEPEEALELCR